jgi:hypothetical protein
VLPVEYEREQGRDPRPRPATGGEAAQGEADDRHLSCGRHGLVGCTGSRARAMRRGRNL